jgi:hypothetical protein
VPPLNLCVLALIMCAVLLVHCDNAVPQMMAMMALRGGGGGGGAAGGLAAAGGGGAVNPADVVSDERLAEVIAGTRMVCVCICVCVCVCMCSMC